MYGISLKQVAIVALLGLIVPQYVEAKKTKLTHYWIASEKDFPIKKEKDIKKEGGGVIARVSKAFYSSLETECSGILADGRIVNAQDHDCTVFSIEKAALGSQDNPLTPYVSVASNSLKFGSKIVIEKYKGTKMPNGKSHNGCFVVGDTCHTCEGKSDIDIYAFLKSNYEKYSGDLDGSADFVQTNCTPGKWV